MANGLVEKTLVLVDSRGYSLRVNLLGDEAELIDVADTIRNSSNLAVVALQDRSSQSAQR